MNIDCTFIKKYAKILEQLKDSGQPIFDSIKLDFANQKAIFGSQKGYGVVKMPVADYDGQKKPFLVNLSSFVAIVSTFDSLNLEEGYTFKVGKENEFEIAHLEDDYDYPKIEVGQTSKAFSCSKALVKSIKKAVTYTDPDGVASLNGVFFIGGSLVATDKSRLYEEHEAAPKEVTFNLPRAVCDVLTLSVLGEELKIDETPDHSFLVTNGDEITLLFPMNSELSPPPVADERFISKYSHATSIKVKRADFLNLITFMSPFVANAAATRMQLIVYENGVELKTEDNGQRISRKIPLEAKSSFNGEKFWVSNNWMKTIVDSFEEDILEIQMNPASAPLNFFIEGSPATHIVYSKLSEVI